MRRPMMAGNWKMNNRIGDAVALAQAIRDRVDTVANVDRVLCPSFICLPAIQEVLNESSIALGAQNLHWAESGAYTGEVSAPMLESLVTHVIIGHSERRQYFAESDESVNQKVQTALSHGLIPIVCIGESLEQNEAGETEAVVSRQVQAALSGLDAAQVQSLVVAYEPIWAIGTGKAATPEQANSTCAVVRRVLSELHGDATAKETRVLYGGSTNDGNISEIMKQSDIDGALIGGASLKVDSYCAMVEITSALYTE
ncbi:triose-phosphate isomerase [Chloroflexi bacterium TSY]|nr:triose-phosphate isomerase [Chloroflexi bacterium TSY]